MGDNGPLTQLLKGPMRRFTLFVISCAVILGGCGNSTHSSSPSTSSPAASRPAASPSSRTASTTSLADTASPAATPTASLAAGWAMFTPSDGSFSVALPGTPTIKSSSGETTLGTMHVTDYAVVGALAQPTYMVAQGHLPDGTLSKYSAGQLDTFLKAAVGGYANSASGTTSNQADTTFVGHAAKTATVTTKASGNAIQELVAFVTGNDLYILVIAHASTQNVAPNQFFATFQLR